MPRDRRRLWRAGVSGDAGAHPVRHRRRGDGAAARAVGRGVAGTGRERRSPTTVTCRCAAPSCCSTATCGSTTTQRCTRRWTVPNVSFRCSSSTTASPARHRTAPRSSSTALTDLRSQLRRRGGDLVVRRGDPVDETMRIAGQHHAEAVFTSHDVTPLATRRQHRLTEACASERIDFERAPASRSCPRAGCIQPVATTTACSRRTGGRGAARRGAQCSGRHGTSPFPKRSTPARSPTSLTSLATRRRRSCRPAARPPDARLTAQPGSGRASRATATHTTTSPPTPPPASARTCTSAASPPLELGALADEPARRRGVRPPAVLARLPPPGDGRRSARCGTRRLPAPRRPLAPQRATTSRRGRPGRTGYPIVDAGMRQLRRRAGCTTAPG